MEQPWSGYGTEEVSNHNFHSVKSENCEKWRNTMPLLTQFMTFFISPFSEPSATAELNNFLKSQRIISAINDLFLQYSTLLYIMNILY